MDRRAQRQGFSNTAGLYSIWFCIFALFAVILFFVINGKSLYDIGDGVYQQYTYFAYTGTWIRQLFSNIFVRHVFEIPMWNMAIGMGSDSLIFLSSVVSSPLADPTNWISALVPYEFAEYAFNAMIILKMYLAGLSFTYFCHHRGLPGRSTVAAAMVYTFSSVLYIGFTAAWFFNSFCLFPLLMVGVDRLWNNKGYKLYVLILAYCAVSSYYFTYMMGLLIVIYCIIRFMLSRELHNTKSFLRLILRFAGFSLLGIGIGIGLQLPAILNFASLDRMSIKWDPVLFSFSTLKAYLLNAFSLTDIGHEGPWGVCPIVLFALVTLFSRKKDSLLQKVLFAVYTMAFFFPIVGSVFNGFNFPTGRFIFAYIFLLSYIVASEFENILKMNKKTRFILLGVAAVYCAVTFLFADLNGLLSGISLLLFAVSMLIIPELGKQENKRFIFLSLSMLICCVIIGFANLQLYRMQVHMDYGTSYDYILRSNGLDQLTEDEREDLHHVRYDFIPFVIDDVPLNSSMLLNVMGYDFYNSNYNNDIDRYYLDMSVNSNPMGFMLNGLRGRNYLELLNGTKYITVQNNDSHLNAPYSYGNLIHSDDQYYVYESADPVSIIYFYDEAINTSFIENTDPIETEELMMNYLITEDGTDTPDDVYRHTLIDYDVTSSEGITFTGDNTFHVDSTGIMILSFDDIDNSEISVYLDGIDSDHFYASAVSLGHDGSYFISDTIQGRESNSMYYHWKNTFVVNFGFTEDAVNTVRLVFLEGEYTLNDIKIYARSSEDLEQTTEAFFAHADTDSVSYDIDGNHVLINAVADNDKYLYFAIPYSEGWTAVVDGVTVPIQKANIGFMAVPVSSGNHFIELNYRTPYLTEGAALTLISLTVFIAFIIADKKIHGTKH